MNKLILGTAVIAMVQSGIAQAQEPQKCIPPVQAEALITYILPKAVKAAQSKCELTLPSRSALMQEQSERMIEYQEASEAAWPNAKAAVGVIAGDKFPGELDDALIRPLADAIFTGLIAEEIKPKDCGLIDKIYGDLAPMPSSNIASLTVTIIQAATKNDEKKDLPICNAPA